MQPPTSSDRNLLDAYLLEKSEVAFRSLVDVYLPVVWSAAMRITGRNFVQSEEVTQNVFTHLATHAGMIPRAVKLGPWLYRHTTFTACNLIRAESRRRRREIIAATDASLNHESSLEMETASRAEISPEIDLAMQKLAKADREILILRYFENQPLREVGVILGISEEAARKRSARAVEKLREILLRRKTAVTTVFLLSFLQHHAQAGVPVNLCTRISKCAFSHAVAINSVGVPHGLRGFVALVVSRCSLAILTFAAICLVVWVGFLLLGGDDSQPKNSIDLQASRSLAGSSSREVIHAQFQIVEIPSALGQSLLLRHEFPTDDGALLSRLRDLQRLNSAVRITEFVIPSATGVLNEWPESPEEFNYATSWKFETEDSIFTPDFFEARHVGKTGRFVFSPTNTPDIYEVEYGWGHFLETPTLIYYPLEAGKETEQENTKVPQPIFHSADCSGSILLLLNRPQVMFYQLIQASSVTPAHYIVCFAQLTR